MGDGGEQAGARPRPAHKNLGRREHPPPDHSRITHSRNRAVLGGHAIWSSPFSPLALWVSLSAGRTTVLTLCGSRPAVRACSVSARPYSPVTRSSRLTRPEAARTIAVGHVLA